MTRLDQLICAVISSTIVQPLSVKIYLRVYGKAGPPPKMTLEDYDKISDCHDTEVIERCCKIAWGIEQRLINLELQILENSPTQPIRV